MTVLQLVRDGAAASAVVDGVDGPNGEKKKGSRGAKLRIQSQNDLYQVNEFVKFVSVFGLLSIGVYAWQLFATLVCVLGAGMGWPVSWVEEKGVGGNQERSLREIVKG